MSLGDTHVSDLQVIDVNDDGYDDLVGAGNDFWVRLGNASGFDPAITTSTNYEVRDIRAGTSTKEPATST